MKILITGATGLIGSVLGRKLTDLGHSIVVVTRNSIKAREQLSFQADFIECDLNTRPLSRENFNDIEAVVNLAGESIDGWWTHKKKNKILNSRKISAHNLLMNCPSTVKIIITASAQGVYGDRADEELTEASAEGEGFLAETCKAWEVEFKNLQQRTVILRIGMVLSKNGGALKKIQSLFKKNLGAGLGSGRQWMSYISLNDLIRIIIEALTNEKYKGVINAVNNSPVTNTEFTKLLCEKLNVLRWPSVPIFVLRIILGEMSQLVLSSLKVKPQKLNELGFEFYDTDLEKILTQELGTN